MKKKAGKGLADIRKMRLKNLLVISILFLPIILYMSYCASGLFCMKDVLTASLQERLVWCLKHPLDCFNEKTVASVSAGFLVWLLITFSAYTKMNNNLMHGKEHGTAKWGDIQVFNRKYSSKKEQENKILSENIRFRYDSSTLRNNNIFVVGGSGAGKTSFFLTPNLLKLHGSNIYTDPKGTLVEEFGNYLQAQPDSNVYCINLCEMEKSMNINPFLFIRKPQDITKLVSNLIQNTNSENIKTSSADPFWEKAEKMFLESIFLYVWMECPIGTTNIQTGKITVLEKTFKSVMYLINEAKMEEEDTPSLLDTRMKKLEKKVPDHPAVRAYNRYRSGPDDTVRSVLMTVNSRMQPFDNEELLEIFSDNDIPLDEIGVGKDGDRKTKSNLFIVIPDDDDTYNFVPGMIYTLLFQELYYQARLFHGRLPIDVGFWFDEFANIKMPSNFERILATCRSRGIYCVPILQSLAQIKKLLSDGAWEGAIGNCDTLIYLGGNEPSTFEYISKLLGKWTIDKKTNGENKGTSGSVSENYDVLGRELMMEYEVRLLPEDECIIFVRGEEPLRDKKWYPWEHKEYDEAKAFGVYEKPEKKEEKEGLCRFLDEDAMDYQKALAEKNPKVKIYGMDSFEFMMMDLDAMESERQWQFFDADNPFVGQISVEQMEKFYLEEIEREAEEKKQLFMENYEALSLLDIYSSDCLNDTRKRVIQELLKKGAPEEDIKSIIHPMLAEGEVLGKKKAYLLMHSLEG